MSGAVVCFGELLLRLGTPAGRLIVDTPALEVVVGGAEANVAVALASLGYEARMVSAVPAGPLGARAVAALAGCGVETRFVRRGPGRMGLYFIETGAGLRPSGVVYDRAGSVFATARAADFDFAGALAGARLLHLSGITAALGPGGLDLALAAMAAARAAGAAVSFDCNYRALLWGAWDSDPVAALTALVGGADIVFANHRDMTLLLGRAFSGEGPERRREAAEAAFGAFPRLSVMAATARQPVTHSHHRIAARIDRRDDHYQTDEIAITDIVDRIGTGDAFAAGVLDGWLAGGDPRAMAETGLAMSALKHGLHGDFCRVGRADLGIVAGIGGDVRR